MPNFNGTFFFSISVLPLAAIVLVCIRFACYRCSAMYLCVAKYEQTKRFIHVKLKSIFDDSFRSFNSTFTNVELEAQSHHTVH